MKLQIIFHRISSKAVEIYAGLTHKPNIIRIIFGVAALELLKVDGIDTINDIFSSKLESLIENSIFQRIVSQEVAATICYPLITSETPAGPIDEEESLMMFPDTPALNIIKKRTALNRAKTHISVDPEKKPERQESRKSMYRQAFSVEEP